MCSKNIHCTIFYPWTMLVPQWGVRANTLLLDLAGLITCLYLTDWGWAVKGNEASVLFFGVLISGAPSCHAVRKPKQHGVLHVHSKQKPQCRYQLTSSINCQIGERRISRWFHTSAIELSLTFEPSCQGSRHMAEETSHPCCALLEFLIHKILKYKRAA